MFAHRASLCALLSVVFGATVTAQDRRPDARHAIDGVKVVRDVTFGSTGDRPLRLHVVRSIEAITDVSADDPPFLIVHGDRDRFVPLNQSELLRDALRASGVPVTLHVVEGGGHGQGFPLEVDRMVVDFFDRTLKPAEDSIPKDSDRR
jgi:acetyl esterase/lipase